MSAAPSRDAGEDERERIRSILHAYASELRRDDSFRNGVDATRWAVDAILSDEDPRTWPVGR